MKIPQKPPDDADLRKILSVDYGTQLRIFHSASGPTVDGKYLHWDQLRHRQPPEGLTHVEWWISLTFHRNSTAKKIPLLDKDRNQFKYLIVDPVPSRLHEIDLGAGGLIQMPEQLTNPDTRDQYYVNSLIEEAITSSQLEGATTTRQIAKEMIRTKRKPQDRSEQMILNN